MFGFNRRPEPCTKIDAGMTGVELMATATGWQAKPADLFWLATMVMRRRPVQKDDRDLYHAAIPIADLWAFETGRLP